MGETVSARTEFLREVAREAGPRFHLRFEEGRGYLELAQEQRRPLFTLRHAKLALSRVKFPIAVGGGASRFRTRHTHLRHVDIELSLGALLEYAKAQGVQLRVHTHNSEGGYVCSLELPEGVIAFRGHIMAAGTDILLAVEDEHRIVEDTTTVWQRIASAFLALGAEFDEERGVFVWADALSAMLRDALCRHGWKLPDARAIQLDVVAIPAMALRLSTRTDASTSAATARVRDAMRGLSEARVRLLLGDHEGAIAALQTLPAEHPATPNAHNLLLRLRLDMGEQVTAAAFTRDDVRLRQAIRDARADDAAMIARDMDANSEVPELAAQALYVAAVAQAPDAVAVRAELLERAVGKDGADARIAAEALSAFVANSDRGAIDRLARSLVAFARNSDAHATVLRDVARAHLAHGNPKRALDILRFVLEVRPSDPEAWAITAELLCAADVEGALEAYDRAAALFAESGLARDAARMHSDAAVIAAQADREHLALDLAEKARALDPRNVAFAVLAAQLAVKVGIHILARDSLSQILSMQGEAESLSGLRIGADYYEAMGDPVALRSFVDALERHLGDTNEVTTRRASLQAMFTDEWLENPGRVPLPTSDELDVFGSRARIPRDAVASLLRAIAGKADLPPEKIASVLRSAKIAASRAGDAAVTEQVVAAIAQHASVFQDAAELEALELLTASAENVALLARRAAFLHKEAGEFGRSALALGRAGIAANDSQLIRAAIETAHRASAWSDAIALVDSALELVRGGPARDALLERRAEFAAQLRATRD